VHVLADAAKLMYDRHADPPEMFGIADLRKASAYSTKLTSS
jgi:hypothetical protein